MGIIEDFVERKVNERVKKVRHSIYLEVRNILKVKYGYWTFLDSPKELASFLLGESCLIEQNIRRAEEAKLRAKIKESLNKITKETE